MRICTSASSNSPLGASSSFLDDRRSPIYTQGGERSLPMPGSAAHPSRRRISHRPSRKVIREFPDRGALWLLEDPVHVRGLLQILEPTLAARLDFEHAERINRSFVPADLQKQESDLIFRVRFLGDTAEPEREVWVYVLLEHQSVPDPEMGLRLYLYMGQLWDSQRRVWQDARLPTEQQRLHPVIPVVLYTGTAPWNVPIGLANLMDLPGELEAFTPGWETLFLNLHETPPGTLTRFATAVGWALRVLQAERAPRAEMERVLVDAMAGLEGLTEDQAGQWLRVAWFLVLFAFHRRGENELVELIQERAQQSKFRQKKELANMGQTIAQRIAEQATREALETVLVDRFGTLPEAIQQRLATTDAETMRRWLKAALRAGSLEEVGILGQAPKA
jgi:Putative transposase, YhgA-like